MNKLKRIEKERSIWEKLATNYDAKTLKRYENAYRLSIEKTRTILSKNQKVLEIACGTGIISLGIASFVDRIEAVDISTKMIEIAKKKAKECSIRNIEFKVADGYSLSYKDESFDTILLFNTLHIVEDPNAILQEAYRLLKPAGFLVTATDCYAEPVPFVVRMYLSIQKLLHKIGIIPFIWYYKKDDIHQVLVNNSFELIQSDILHVTPVNYFVLAKKKKE